MEQIQNALIIGDLSKLSILSQVLILLISIIIPVQE